MTAPTIWALRLGISFVVNFCAIFFFFVCVCVCIPVIGEKYAIVRLTCNWIVVYGIKGILENPEKTTKRPQVTGNFILCLWLETGSFFAVVGESWQPVHNAQDSYHPAMGAAPNQNLPSLLSCLDSDWIAVPTKFKINLSVSFLLIRPVAILFCSCKAALPHSRPV